MAAAKHLVYTIIESLVSLIGVLAGSFIVTLNLQDCTKGRSLKACDLILVVMSISSSCFQCTLVALLILEDNPVLDNAAPVFNQLACWFGSSSNWFTSCLCIFYCVKIVDFKHPVFFWLKLRISKAVPWLLLSSALCFLAVSMPSYWVTSGNNYRPSRINFTDNSTLTERNVITTYYVVAGFLGFCLPLLIDMASIALILISLYRHTQRMKENTSGFSQPRMEAHFGAARMVGSLLLVYTLFLMANCVIISFPHLWMENIFGIIIFSASTAQFIILIMGTPKLRQALWKLMPSCRK